MKIGVPTEIKSQENRVAITPAGVHHLTLRDHQVLVQAGAGIGSAMTDDAFRQAGATIAITQGPDRHRLTALDLEPLRVGVELGFVCGSARFAEAMSSTLVEVGLPADRIRVERFGPTG